MITPTGHKVLVLSDPVQKESEGGIILTATPEQERMEKAGNQRGLVVGIGPSAWKAFREVNDGKEYNGKRWAEIGDYVIFARHAGRFISDPFQKNLDGELLIMNDEDIVAILTKGENEVPDNPHREKII